MFAAVVVDQVLRVLPVAVVVVAVVVPVVVVVAVANLVAPAGECWERACPCKGSPNWNWVDTSTFETSAPSTFEASVPSTSVENGSEKAPSMARWRPSEASSSCNCSACSRRLAEPPA